MFYWLFGTQSLWWDALLNVHAVGYQSVLSQLNVPAFVDPAWEDILFWRSGRRDGRVNCKIKK